MEKVKDWFCVAGFPVSHSLSPQIHRSLFNASGISGKYARLSAQSPQDAIRAAKEIGFRGMNITSPLKGCFVQFLDWKSEEVTTLGCTNTVLFSNGAVKGYNTDPKGVLLALKGALAEVEGKKVAVLGAGGAARAAVHALANYTPYITVFNRTVSKAQAISESFGVEQAELNGGAADLLRSFDVIVSCLSTTEKFLPESFLSSHHVVLDANYRQKSWLVSDAEAHGSAVISGIEWLKHQAIEAFQIFTGVKPPLKASEMHLSGSESRANRPIAIVGFSGSGKTTLGRALAAALGWDFVDSDELIEDVEGCPISDIFSIKGERYFRRLEAHTLDRVSSNRNTVVACGGGAVSDESCFRLLQERFTVVWLWVSPETVLLRLKDDHSRPLLETEDKEKAVMTLLKERKPLYLESSDFIVKGDGKELSSLVSQVKGELL